LRAKREWSWTEQFRASEARMAISTARLLSTGRVPGRPRQTGQTLVLGGSPKRVEQPQKIFVRVRSWTWTSKPMTGSYFASTSGAMEGASGADFAIRDKDYSIRHTERRTVRHRSGRHAPEHSQEWRCHQTYGWDASCRAGKRCSARA